MIPKRRIGAGRMTAQAKQQARRAIGRLSDGRLKPTTVAKYKKAVVDFFEFCYVSIFCLIPVIFLCYYVLLSFPRIKERVDAWKIWFDWFF